MPLCHINALITNPHHVGSVVLRVGVRHDVKLNAAVLDKAVHAQQVRGRFLHQLLLGVHRQVSECNLILRAMATLSMIAVQSMKNCKSFTSGE